MKKVFYKATRNERGQALPLVLILLLLGGLIIAPLLAFMSTGLIAGQAYEERMSELYAADAGIEDAIWKITNLEPDALPTDPYYLTANNKNVEVQLPSQHDTTIDFFKNVGALEPQGQGD